MRSVPVWVFSVAVGAIAVGALAAAPTPAAAEPIAADKLPEPALGGPAHDKAVGQAPGQGPAAEKAAGEVAAYLRKVHEQVHKRWAGNFLRLVSEQLPVANPVNAPERTALAELVITADGRLLSVALSESGGFPGFDDAITEVLHDAAPFPEAPLDARSDDNAVHLRWRFARDQRRCSEVAIIHMEDPLAQAVPKLLRDEREGEVLRRLRVARAAGSGIEPMMSTVAGQWLKATMNAPYATVRSAEALASLGDAAGIRWLEMAVKRPEWAAAAGEALAAHRVPICPVVGGAFELGIRNHNQNLADQQLAAVALATAAEADCVPGLIRLLENPKARPEARAAAAVALGPMLDARAKANARPASDLARDALATAAQDQSATVRAAAILAAIRPGSGRGKVYSLVPALRDASPEVRAAAAAGVVRAGGDANLDDLYVVFKDSDPRAAQAVAVELDRLQTEESTKFLVRLLRRPQLSVQLAAARALVKRGARDWFAALRPLLNPKADPQLRALALASADEGTLESMARTLTQQAAALGPENAQLPGQALALYRARLARGERTPAADVLIATGTKLSLADQADAMADWMKTRGPMAPSAAKGPAPTAAPAAATPSPTPTPKPATTTASGPAPTAGRAARKR